MNTRAKVVLLVGVALLLASFLGRESLIGFFSLQQPNRPGPGNVVSTDWRPVVIPCDGEEYLGWTKEPVLRFHLREGTIFCESHEIALPTLKYFVDKRAPMIGARSVMFTGMEDERFGSAMAVIDECRQCRKIHTIFLNTSAIRADP